MALLYNFDSCILLPNFVIDIAYSKFLIGRHETNKSFVAGVNFIGAVCGSRFITIGSAKYFFGRFLGFGFSAGTFFFVDSISIGYQSGNFAPNLDSLMKSLLVIIIYLI